MRYIASMRLPDTIRYSLQGRQTADHRGNHSRLCRGALPVERKRLTLHEAAVDLAAVLAERAFIGHVVCVDREGQLGVLESCHCGRGAVFTLIDAVHR